MYSLFVVYWMNDYRGYYLITKDKLLYGMAHLKFTNMGSRFKRFLHTLNVLLTVNNCFVYLTHSYIYIVRKTN